MVLLGLILLLLVCSYSTYLSLRGIIRLYKIGSKKMFACALAVFVLVPILLVIVLLAPRELLSIWIVLPLGAFSLGWLFLGYLLRRHMAHQKELQLSGRKRVVLQPTRKIVITNLLLIVAALIIWAIGAFIGIKWPTIETCAVCAAVFMFAKGLGTLWKYRDFD